MACRGFSAYWGADEGRWVIGWIREPCSEKLEQDMEQSDEKMQVWQWFWHARKGFIEEVVMIKRGARKPEQEQKTGDIVRGAHAPQWGTEWTAAKVKHVHAQIQGLCHAMGMIKRAAQAAQAAQTWEVGMSAELKRHEAIYTMEQKQERKMVQAQG